MDKRSCSIREAKAIEDRIVQECRSHKKKWTDPTFGPENSSIFKRDAKLGVDSWKRLTEIGNPGEVSVFLDGVSSGDIVQEYGFFQIKLYKNGAWRVVTIDDYVPMKFNQIRFGKCSDTNEIWVPLIEKAFAKLNGNYEQCASGHFGEAMTDLTGEGCESFETKTVDPKSFWDQLVYFHEEAFLMGCSVPLPESGGSIESDNGRGLLMGHAYGVLRVVQTRRGQRLLQIRNPWGSKEWNGPYSDGSREMTPELRAELNHKDADDGTFYMSYEDWLANFSDFAVCRLLQDEIGTVWEKRVFFGRWDENTAGGCGNTIAWKKNDQFWISVLEPDTRMFFHLAQEDVRSQFKPSIEFSIGLYLMTHDTTMAKKMNRTRAETLHTPTFINRREYSFSCTLQPGIYLIMPCTFDPDQFAQFYLTVYSEKKCEAGRIGHGTAPKEKVYKFDMSELSWLNKPGTQGPSSSSGARSPRRFAPVSPRRAGAVSPRRAPPPASSASSVRSTMLSPSSAVASPNPMVAEALKKMSDVLADIMSTLRAGLRSDDPAAALQGAQQTLKFFHSKFADVKAKVHSAEERSLLSALEEKIRECDSLVAQFKPASAPAVAQPTSAPAVAQPTSAPASSISNFSVDQLAEQLRQFGVTDSSIAKFRNEKIDGRAFIVLSESDLKEELALPLGDRKKIQSLMSQHRK